MNGHLSIEEIVTHVYQGHNGHDFVAETWKRLAKAIIERETISESIFVHGVAVLCKLFNLPHENAVEICQIVDKRIKTTSA